MWPQCQWSGGDNFQECSLTEFWHRHCCQSFTSAEQSEVQFDRVLAFDLVLQNPKSWAEDDGSCKSYIQWCKKLKQNWRKKWRENRKWAYLGVTLFKESLVRCNERLPTQSFHCRLKVLSNPPTSAAPPSHRLPPVFRGNPFNGLDSAQRPFNRAWQLWKMSLLQRIWMLGMILTTIEMFRKS